MNDIGLQNDVNVGDETMTEMAIQLSNALDLLALTGQDNTEYQGRSGTPRRVNDPCENLALQGSDD